jgi:hypothetical protein
MLDEENEARISALNQRENARKSVKKWQKTGKKWEILLKSGVVLGWFWWKVSKKSGKVRKRRKKWTNIFRQDNGIKRHNLFFHFVVSGSKSSDRNGRNVLSPGWWIDIWFTGFSRPRTPMNRDANFWGWRKSTILAPPGQGRHGQSGNSYQLSVEGKKSFWWDLGDFLWYDLAMGFWWDRFLGWGWQNGA